jgi:magnesium transporter
MLGNLFGPEISDYIETRNFASIRALFEGMPAADVGEIISDLAPENQAIVFRILPQDRATEVLEYLGSEEQERIIRNLGNEEAARILNDMSDDDRTALLEELPPTIVTQLLTLLSPEEQQVARTLLGYPEGSVGRLMTTEFLTVRPEWTVGQCLDHIRTHGSDSETLNVIYVTDPTGRLIDDVHIREFLLRPVEAKVSELHDNRFLALRAADTQEAALSLFKKYDRNTLPVVDSGEVLLGIVTVDDMLHVQEEVATEDIQKIGGMEALDTPYMETSVVQMIRKRAIWLIVLFVGEMFTASAMGFFENELQKTVVLSLFIPLILASGGNSGSQTSTLIIRALALGEITLRDWWRVMAREVVSGAALGTLLGLLGFARITLSSLFGDGYGPHSTLLGSAIGVTILGVVMWGTLAGSMLPLVLRRVGLDPATSCTPFVATLVDVTGLMIYFGSAIFFLRGTILPH